MYDSLKILHRAGYTSGKPKYPFYNLNFQHFKHVCFIDRPKPIFGHLDMPCRGGHMTNCTQDRVKGLLIHDQLYLGLVPVKGLLILDRGSQMTNCTQDIVKGLLILDRGSHTTSCTQDIQRVAYYTLFSFFSQLKKSCQLLVEEDVLLEFFEDI